MDFNPFFLNCYCAYNEEFTVKYCKGYNFTVNSISEITVKYLPLQYFTVNMDIEKLLSLIQEGESEKVEFKQKPTNILNKELTAFANASGGYLFIGVDDHGKIVGTDIKAAQEAISAAAQNIIPPLKLKTQKFSIDGRDILAVEVKKGDTLSSVGGVVYIRIGCSSRPLSIQEIVMLSSELGTLNWDEVPLLPFEVVKSEFLDWFFTEITKSKGKSVADEDRNRYLGSAGALKNSMLTNAGTLFFTDVKEFIPHARIRMIGMEKDQPVWSKEYEGPVWKCIESAYEDLLREVKKIEFLMGTKRVKMEEYPPRALREAIINAVSHRNYVINADVRVFLYPDRIEIKNPGGLLPGVDLEDPDHVPRNPAICNLLYDTGFIERYGYGIQLIKKEIENNPLCSVTFKTDTNRFTVIFKKTLSMILDDYDKKILQSAVSPLKSSEIAELTGISKPTALQHIKKLEQLKLIRRIGSGSQTKYEVVR